MRSITAVEIGADICALARTSVSGGNVHLWAAETLDPGAFPGVDAFTQAVRQSRRALKLPRKCRAVVWGLPDGASRRDPVVVPLIEPLTKAGFKVARVVTPCNALGALARLRTSRAGGAMCWLGINRNGVAIVVVRPGKLLYSHSFAWDSNVGASGSQARLLQRYSLVAFLAPEVRRAIAAARQKGTTVDGIITCGNLPDLRSLTMPLIEELDIEVETLDSLEGLVVKPESADKLAEAAVSIRLACAGAIARETRSVDEGKRRRVRRGTRFAVLLRVAVVLAAVGGAGYWYYLRTRPPAPPAPAPASAPRSAPGGATAGKPASAPPVQSPPAPSVAQSSNPPVTIPQKLEIPPKGGSYSDQKGAAPSVAQSSNPPVTIPQKLEIPPKGGSYSDQKGAASSVAQTSNPPPAIPPLKIPQNLAIPPKGGSYTDQKGPSQPPVTTKANPPPPVAPPPSSAPPPAPRGATEGKPASAPAGTLSSPPVAADKPVATAPRPAAGKPPELLKDPVPRVTAILTSADRHLATIGDEGQIVAVGDAIGRRVVVGIDDKTVLLREPSGVQIRVALGGRVVGVEREDR